MRHDPEFKKVIESNPEYQKQHIIWTNGHFWRLYEFDLEFRSRHTSIFRPKTVQELDLEERNFFGRNLAAEPKDRKIWYDFEMMQLALGIVRYSTGVRTEGEKKLHESYRYLRDLKYMDRLEDRERHAAKSAERIRRFLPRWISKKILRS